MRPAPLAVTIHQQHLEEPTQPLVQEVNLLGALASGDHIPARLTLSLPSGRPGRLRLAYTISKLLLEETSQSGVPVPFMKVAPEG